MDELTLFLGKAYGVYFLLIGVVTLVYVRELQEAVEEFAMSKMLFYLSGHSLFVLGVLAALAHTRFDTVLGTIVTTIGYLILFKGVLILALPHRWIGGCAQWFNTVGWYIVFGGMSILIGGVLVFITFALPLIA